jgi:hypothetical protein
MSYRSDAYEHNTTTDSIKELSERLTADVRSLIRSLVSEKAVNHHKEEEKKFAVCIFQA